jgi:hypothetical protein
MASCPAVFQNGGRAQSGARSMIGYAPVACALLLSVAACAETREVQPVPVAGGDLSSPAAVACRAAIARQVGVSPAEVAVFDVADSEAGVGVQANVAGAEAPWSCRADRSGRVQGVMYTGSEGAL